MSKLAAVEPLAVSCAAQSPVHDPESAMLLAAAAFVANIHCTLKRAWSTGMDRT